MIKKLLDTLQPPSADRMASRELLEAQRDLLQALSAAEYASNMVKYHQQRINRLKGYLHDQAPHLLPA